MKVKEESEKVGLKLNIQKIKIMASDPITSWEIEIDGETVSDFILGASKSLQMVIAAMKLKNLKNIQATYAAQFHKNKRPNQKMGQRTK